MTEEPKSWCWGLGMPHLEVVCLFCGGIIRDLLLECVPEAKRGTLAYALLMELNPGVAFPCPYCSALLGFDEHHKLRVPASGWPVLRYGWAELQLRKDIDGEPSSVALPDWGRKH